MRTPTSAPFGVRTFSAIALCLALTGGAHAADGSAQIARVPLVPQRTGLNGGIAETHATIHLPGGAAIRRAQLVLGYANALAVEPDGSGLRVSANGSPLAELPLVASQGVVQAEIDVPAAIFRPGANTLTFRTHQEHRLECERESFKELWTRLDPERSYLEVELAPSPGRPALSQLESLLASSLYDGEPFTVLSTRPPADAAAAEWGGILAEGVALRRGERPLEVNYGQFASPGQAGLRWQALKGQNYALIGTLDELAPVLPQGLPEGAAHGLVALRPLAADPGHFAVIVTGASEAAVTHAAEVFRTTRRSWPDAPAMATGLAPRETVPARAQAVQGNRAVTLAALGYTTQDLPLSFTETIDLEVVFPDDYYGGDGQRIELLLNLAYGAGLAADSALIIRVNGAPWNMLRLDRSTGDFVESARVELPMGLFNPGPNTIGFEPVLHPAHADACAATGEQPMFSLFDDSRIVVPEFARLARQPDLGLFAAAAFPYGGEAGVELVVGEASAEVLGAAWTLRAKLAQQQGRPLANLVTSFAPSEPKRHLLVVAPASKLPQEIARSSPMPLQPATAGAVLKPGAGDASLAADAPAAPASAPSGSTRTQAARGHWAQRLLVNENGREEGIVDALTGWLINVARAVPATKAPLAPSFEELDALAVGSSAGVMAAFRSPFAQDRTATVVTASNAAALDAAVARLIDPPVWQRVQGDVTVWGAEPGQVLSHRVAAPYVVAPVETSPRHLWLLWRSFMAERPGYWLVLSLGLVAAFSLVTGLLLRRRLAG